MSWWHWLAIGLILVLLELASAGGFYVIFFGVAAIAISGLHVLGLAGPLWSQLLLFSVFSVAALLLFRRPLLDLVQPTGPTDVDSLVGEIAVPLDDIAAGAVGRAELRGTVWTSRNTTGEVLIRGQRCRVVSIDRLMLFLEAEGVRA